MELQQAKQIAAYEVKILLRNPIFRIFMALAVCTIPYVLYISLSRSSTALLPCSFPLWEVYLFNFLQSLWVVFAIAEVVRREQKLDTVAALQARAYSNTSYLCGKAGGICKVFILLNIILLAIAMFIHFFIGDTLFRFFPYVFYWLVLSVPSLLFVSGLAFYVTAVFKSQTFTLLLLITFLFCTFFYLPDILYGAFDFSGTGLPNVFSDVTGHPALANVLIHRLAFLLLGMGLWILAVVRAKRLPDSPSAVKWKKIVASVVIVCGILSLAGYNYIYIEGNGKRDLYRSVFEKYAFSPHARVIRHELTCHPQDRGLDMTSRMTVQNRNTEKLSTIILYLNPGLILTRLESGGEVLMYCREEQAVVIEHELLPGDSLVVCMDYSGQPDGKICYVDIPDKDYYITRWGDEFVRYGSQPVFTGKEYTLLTPECLWYPVAVAPVNLLSPFSVQRNFTEYSLRVIREDTSKMVISQGTPQISGDTVIYTNKERLPSLSLVIGNYERKEMVMDSVLYELYLFGNYDNDFLYNDYAVSGEGVGGGIRQIRDQFEQQLDRKYPYGKLACIEVPINFPVFPRNWKKGSEFIQPELVFFPERTAKNGCGVFTHSVKEDREDMKKMGGHFADIPDIEMERGAIYFMLTSFVGGQVSRGNIIVNWLIPRIPVAGNTEGDFTPLFTDYTMFVNSPEVPVMDWMLQSMFDGLEWETYARMRRRSGYTMVDGQAIGYLAANSLKDALRDTNISQSVLKQIIKMKGAYLRDVLAVKIPRAELKKKLTEFCTFHRFREFCFEDLKKELERMSGMDLTHFMEEWYTQRGVPEFLVNGIQVKKAETGEDGDEKFIVSFNVWNKSPVDGLISYSMEGRRQDRLTESPPVHYLIGSGECRMIRLSYPEAPRVVQVGTNISGNMPLDFSAMIRGDIGVARDTVCGIFDADTKIFAPEPFEIIVDNEDENFRLPENVRENKLRSLFHKEEAETDTYIPSYRWRSGYDALAYGGVRRSYSFHLGGKGLAGAEWTADIPAAGYYEVFVYNIKPQVTMSIVPADGIVGKPSEKIQYYKICHDGGEEEVSYIVEKSPGGWLSFGEFYFSEGKAKVILLDKISYEGQVICADAVKWVKVKD